MTFKSGRFALVCGVALLSAMCSSDSSPTGPTATPIATPTPTPTPPPAPVANGRVEVSVVPNPVPFSGQPITDAAGCANSKNTWFYDQVLRETGGAEVTLRTRVDRFDGAAINNLSVSIVVPANGSVTLKSRWCSVTAAEHSAQTSFTGADANGNSVSVTGPVVPLMKP